MLYLVSYQGRYPSESSGGCPTDQRRIIHPSPNYQKGGIALLTDSSVGLEDQVSIGRKGEMKVSIGTWLSGCVEPNSLRRSSLSPTRV